MDMTPVQCPWCGERFDALVDASGGSAEYTEDCEVCCRPIVFQLEAGVEDGDFQLHVCRENE